MKSGNRLVEMVMAHHPFDVVGWDGYYYPWAFSIHDFEPRVGRVHLPPPVHQTFEGDGFVVCSFCPRPYDFDPEAVPAPYIGEPARKKVVDLVRVEGEAAITGPHGVAVGFFRWRQQVVGHRGVEFTVVELADNRHFVFFGVAVSGHHVHGRAFAHDIALGLFVEKAAIVVGQEP